MVKRESPGGGREVWYRLSEAGHRLGPAVHALTLWGIEPAFQPPMADEPVHPGPVMLGTKVWLNRNTTPPPDGLAWVWRFAGEDYYTLRVMNGAWELTCGKGGGAVLTVDATRQSWPPFSPHSPAKRRLPAKDIRLEGARSDVRTFAEAFRAKAGNPPSAKAWNESCTMSTFSCNIGYCRRPTASRASPASR